MALTAAKLNNADQDCATLEQVVNGAASPGTLTSRLGRSLSTIAKLVADFVAALPRWRSTWSAATAYVVGDCVTYGGSSFVAIQAGTNHLPTDTAYWTLIAQTGDISQARTQNNTWTGVNTFPTPAAGTAQAATAAYAEAVATASQPIKGRVKGNVLVRATSGTSLGHLAGTGAYDISHASIVVANNPVALVSSENMSVKKVVVIIGTPVPGEGKVRFFFADDSSALDTDFHFAIYP